MAASKKSGDDEWDPARKLDGVKWLARLRPLLARVPLAGLGWLLAGGLFYTGGVIFYVTDARVRFGHAAWHVCVLSGTTCHFFAVLLHSAPAIA